MKKPCPLALMQVTPFFAELQVMPASEVFFPIASTAFSAGIASSTQLGEPLTPSVVVRKTNSQPAGHDFGGDQLAFLIPHRAAPRVTPLAVPPTRVQMMFPSGVLNALDEPDAEAALGITASPQTISKIANRAEPFLRRSISSIWRSLGQIGLSCAV